MGLLIFDTHPIQYRSPVFQSLAEKRARFKVYFFNESFNGRRWWFHEVGKIPKQDFAVPMKQGFPNAIVGTRQLGWWGTVRSLARILREERPSEVAVYGYYEIEHWMLRVLCAWYRIPLIFIGETFHSGPWSLRRVIKTPLRNYFFSGVHRFIAIGQKTWVYYRGLGVPESKLVRAKYCTDFRFFRQTPDQSLETRRRWRMRWGIPDDAFVVLFVGRLFERKRPVDAVCLHRRLLSKDRVYTVMVGNGPLEDSLRKESAILPRLIWTGFQNQAATRDAYHGSDILVVPSEYETWGLVVNEAAACSLPAAVTDTCGVAGDLVLDGETGLIFAMGDVESLAFKLRHLIDSPDTLVQLGTNAREKVEREFSVEQFADAFVKAAVQPLTPSAGSVS